MESVVYARKKHKKNHYSFIRALLKKAMLLFFVLNPAVEIVVKAWLRLSNQSIPAKNNKAISKTVKIK